ncbi:polysaccharide deacetylase family protein [Ancylomarina sp. YFZ004]
MERGKFIISLDFELHWGAAEKWDINNKKNYFNQTRESIPLILSLFEKYSIHATWATVGFLFANNKEQLLNYLPKERPSYKNGNLSSYKLLDDDNIGDNENDDPYHYAGSIISQIIKTPNQELASHTFSHYYCNELGQSIEQFNADLKAAQYFSKVNFDIELKTLVFPRNQFNADYLNVAKENGIEVVRSNPDVWFWKNTSKLIPLARAFDTLLPISSSLTYVLNENNIFDEILLLPSSRFFRPYSDNEKLIQNRKLQRIKDEMTYAARKNKIYHLWWHPHNFGGNVYRNIEDLTLLLKHFEQLKQDFGFESNSMIEMKR